ncbi:MAG TPA: hypothetical protein DCL08_02230 [Anaerolineaceae bacterium]|nr:hypothetical protein [Anaerolineaceae bacterium]
MNSTNNINVQVKSLMGFGAWKPHTIKVFVGCGAFFTAPFNDININIIYVQVKYLLIFSPGKITHHQIFRRVRCVFQRTIF